MIYSLKRIANIKNCSRDWWIFEDRIVGLDEFRKYTKTCECDVIAVMYMGRIVEQAVAEELYLNPLHPYTCALLSAIPQVEPSRRRRKAVVIGEVPSALNPPLGCAFHSRCPWRRSDCLTQIPVLKQTSSNKEHFVACRKYL